MWNLEPLESKRRRLDLLYAFPNAQGAHLWRYWSSDYAEGESFSFKLHAFHRLKITIQTLNLTLFFLWVLILRCGYFHRWTQIHFYIHFCETRACFV